MIDLKQQIKEKIQTVIEQYDKKSRLGYAQKAVYIPILKRIENEFFSDNGELQKKAIDGMRSLLLTFKPWEPMDEYVTDKYKDEFVDDFNNFNEWYEFLKSLVKDVEEYHHARLENLNDSKEN